MNERMVAARGFATMSSSIESADNYVAWMLGKFRPFFGNRLLEIGTGWGNFRRHIPPVELFVSVDLDEKIAQQARERDPTGTYVVADAGAEDFVDRCASWKCDTVLCVNVLEHIENDAVAVGNMLDVLQPGGHLLLLVPALPSHYSHMDRLAGHYRRYTKRTLTRCYSDHPCEIVYFKYFNPIGAAGWWVNKFFPTNDLDHPRINRQIELFDKYLVPVSRLLNGLTQAFYGQSLICVARKP